MKRTRREGGRPSLQAVATLILMGWASLAPAAVKKPAPIITPKSNVLLIIGDDMGLELFQKYVDYFNGTSDSGDDISGVTPPSTEYIDRLAESGVTFVNAWASPLCSPSRAGMFTGLYSANNGVVNVMDQQINAAGDVQEDLNPSFTTIPEAISGAGYASGLFGKWHLGTTYHPEDHGWTMFSGVLGGSLDNYYIWDKLVEESGMSPVIYNYTTGNDEDYATFVNVDDAAGWINSQTGKWMATVAFNAAHTTTGSHDFDEADDPPNFRGCSPSGSTVSKDIFHQIITCMDAEIGDLLTQIQSKLSNTVIIFVGDNGTESSLTDFDLFDDHGKGTVYESGIAVPMIIADGNAYLGNGTGVGTGRVVSPGRVSTALVQTIDIFDTVVQIAGGTAYTDDSYSLVDILRNTATTSNRTRSFDEVIWVPPGSDIITTQFAARNSTSKVIWTDSTGSFPTSMEGTCEFYLLSTAGSTRLVSDRWEQSSLSGASVRIQNLLDDIDATLGYELTCR